MAKVYISAPIRGYEFDERKVYFASIASMLTDMGFRVFNPMENIVCGTARPQALKRDIRTLTTDIDLVMMFGTWEDSDGCMLERSVAEAVGIPVVTADVFDEKNIGEWSHGDNKEIRFDGAKEEQEEKSTE